MKSVFNNEKINIKKLNDTIKLGNKILRLLFIFIAIIGVYAITLIFKEWKVVTFLLTILKILSPFFIGLIIAWLLAPCVKFLYKRGINRILATILIYILMLGLLYLAISTFFPLLLAQIKDFTNTLPIIVDYTTNWTNQILNHFKVISVLNVDQLKGDVTTAMQNFVGSLTTDMPKMILNLIKGFLSTVGIFALGLLVGFYLLFDFDNLGKALLSLLPRGWRDDVKGLFKEANAFLFGYVKGTLFVSLLVFVTSTIAFAIVGLKAPLLFGLICGITNVIPYVGPYLGSVPAVIVGFTQGVPTGILVIVAVAIIHTVEGNIIQPIIMSKTMKLHPVTIIIGLLIFGYFFGVIGMILAAPLMATIKSILTFFENKYNILKFNDTEVQ